MVDDGINTSNNNNNNNNPEGEDREINLYAVFFKYMVYWPWFVASVLACCIGMYVFLRYQTPVYNVTSSVLIKEDEKKGANAASGLGCHTGPRHALDDEQLRQRGRDPEVPHVDQEGGERHGPVYRHGGVERLGLQPPVIQELPR